jgi:hypothetical protein
VARRRFAWEANDFVMEVTGVPARRLLLLRLWLPRTENSVPCFTEPHPALFSFHPTVFKSNGALYCLDVSISFTCGLNTDLAQMAISPSRTTPKTGVIYPTGSSPKWAAGSRSEVLMVGHTCPTFVCASPHVYFAGFTQPNFPCNSLVTTSFSTFLSTLFPSSCQ